MSGNRAVVYPVPGKVSLESIEYPELVLKDGPGVPKANVGRQCQHGVILRVVATNICGSDQHMVRGRFATGQCPVMRYNRELMMAILHDRVQIASNVNATVIPLSAAPQGYAEFDQGAAKKFVLDPHGLLGS